MISALRLSRFNGDAGRPVVVATGASAGVGRAIARAYGRRRARVGLLARGRGGLLAARSEVKAAVGEALVVPSDVADAEDVETAAMAVDQQRDGLRLLAREPDDGRGVSACHLPRLRARHAG